VLSEWIFGTGLDLMASDRATFQLGSEAGRVDPCGARRTRHNRDANGSHQLFHDDYGFECLVMSSVLSTLIAVSAVGPWRKAFDRARRLTT
jgi:hypothetical protein